MPKHADSAHLLYHRLGDTRIAAIYPFFLALLDFDIDIYMSLHQLKHLAQRRYLLRLRPAAGEVRGGIQATQISKIEVKNVACAIGTPCYLVIMKDDQLPVTAQMHIQFNRVDRQRQRIAKRRQCIFRRQPGTTAMSHPLKIILPRHYLSTPFLMPDQSPSNEYADHLRKSTMDCITPSKFWHQT